MPDDVGYGSYACPRNPTMRAPPVDAFEKQSLLLTQFHVSSTCSPTRAALVSGWHEFKNGVTHNLLERERQSGGTLRGAKPKFRNSGPRNARNMKVLLEFPISLDGSWLENASNPYLPWKFVPSVGIHFPFKVKTKVIRDHIIQ